MHLVPQASGIGLILKAPYQNKRTVPPESTLPKTTFVPGVMFWFSHVCAALIPPCWVSPAGAPLVGATPGPVNSV